MIERGGILEFFPIEENHFEIGGFARLKAWLESARVGFSEEARALNLDAPKGVLLVGVQGCGKSLAAKFIAREWQLPLLKLDAGRLYEKYVGESEKNFRNAPRSWPRRWRRWCCGSMRSRRRSPRAAAPNPTAASRSASSARSSPGCRKRRTKSSSSAPRTI